MFLYHPKEHRVTTNFYIYIYVYVVRSGYQFSYRIHGDNYCPVLYPALKFVLHAIHIHIYINDYNMIMFTSYSSLIEAPVFRFSSTDYCVIVNIVMVMRAYIPCVRLISHQVLCAYTLINITKLEYYVNLVYRLCSVWESPEPIEYHGKNRLFVYNKTKRRFATKQKIWN